MALQPGKLLQVTALAFQAVGGEIGMSVGKIAVILGLNLAALVGLHVAPRDDPCVPQGGEACTHFTAQRRITPGPAGVVNPDRRVFFQAAARSLRPGKADFPERNLQILMDAPADVDTSAVRKLVAAVGAERIFRCNHRRRA